MGLLDIFRRQPPIRDLAALADFIDGNAAFLMQKGLYEYSRARAGHYAKVLFREPEFHAAVEVSRWRAYPLGLAMVTEMAEGVLRTHVGDRRAALNALNALVLGVFDRYPVPADLSGLRCLDVGTMDGFWAFEMERRGAASVTAIDLDDPNALD